MAEQVHVPAARPRLPEWLKVKMPGSPRYIELQHLMRGQKLHTVCEEAHCPNIGECWDRGTATFMILGDICTRRCHYCAVTTGRPAGLDLQEPARLAEIVKQMGLSYCVITSVNRDDLADGGAFIFAECIKKIRQAVSGCKVEGPDSRLRRLLVGAEKGDRLPPRRPQPQHRVQPPDISPRAAQRRLPAILRVAG